MIWLSRLDVFKRILLTLNAANLEFIGAYEFFVRDKKIIKLHGAEVPQYCLFLSTEIGDHGSTVTVSKKKYTQAKLGTSFGLCGVVRNVQHADSIFITENTNPGTAVKQIVRNSWAKMIFVLITFGLCLGSLMLLLYPFLHLSWN